jgi:hypothetical protein
VGDVVKLPCITKLPIEPNDVLTGAIDKMDRVLVLGFDKDGAFYTTASDGDLAQALWLATKFIHKIHAGDYR